MTDTIDAGELGTWVDLTMDELTEDNARAIMQFAQHVGGEIARNAYDRFTDDTGALASSFLTPVVLESTPERFRVSVGSNLPYAAIQDRGGEILGLNGKLAVPISSQAKNLWPRDWPADKLHLIVSRGKALLVERTGNRGRMIVHYILKDKVRIVGTRYFSDVADRVDEMAAEFIEERMQSR